MEIDFKGYKFVLIENRTREIEFIQCPFMEYPLMFEFNNYQYSKMNWTLHTNPDYKESKEMIYTQEMKDKGIPPEVGMIVELTGSPELDAEKLMIGDFCIVDSWINGDKLTVIATVYMFNKKTIVVQNKRTYGVSTIAKDFYKAIDTRTSEEKAIDDLDKILTCENNEVIDVYKNHRRFNTECTALLQRIQEGKIHGVSFTGDKK